MPDKDNQPQREMGVLDKFRLGIIDKFTVPVLGSLKKKKGPKYETRGGHKIRWLGHAEMLMHHNRIAKRRRANQIAKESRRKNRV